MVFFTTITTPKTDKIIDWILFLYNTYKPMFLEGMKYTIIIALTATILGLFIAMFITPLKILKISKRDSLIIKLLKILSVFLTTVYVEVLRGTPMMVQAFIIYYGLVGKGLDLTVKWNDNVLIPGIIVYGILIVSINTSAYIIEVLRGSINSIDKGQMEAARSIGMTRGQAMRHIIIPQALKNSIPPIGNEFVVNIKDTSVLSVIAVTELFFVTKKVSGYYYQMIPTFLIAAGLYLLMTFATTRILYLVSYLLGKSKNTNRKKFFSFPMSQSS